MYVRVHESILMLYTFLLLLLLIEVQCIRMVGLGIIIYYSDRTFWGFIHSSCIAILHEDIGCDAVMYG